ncbi:MAG TPA: DUF1127 domain-containing protein, partial [Gammaproteobacteria bacterium]
MHSATLTSSIRLPHAARRGRGLAAAVLGLHETLACWQERARQRRQLLALDAHALEDVGLSRADALREGS